MALGPHVRILLVDDDAGHTELMRRNLRRHDVSTPVDTVCDGAAALDYVFRRGAHSDRVADGELLVLLDINMPGGVDGVEVLRQVKADALTRRIPVIMLTTTDDPREVERCHALGCDAYVTKPVDLKAFISTAQRLGLPLAPPRTPGNPGPRS